MKRRRFSFSKSFETTVTPTEHVRACAAMFGIGIDDAVVVTLYKDLEVTLGHARVVYITGDSGAGKSTLLADIKNAVAEHSDEFALVEVDDGDLDVPILDQFGEMDLPSICELLNFVGISEAFVYLRTPRQLSDGQRYRYRLARMIDGALKLTGDRQPVIVVDEYLAVLDREVARNVAYQTRRIATKFGLCFAVATTHTDIADDLQANMTITLRLALEPEVTKNTFAS